LRGTIFVVALALAGCFQATAGELVRSQDHEYRLLELNGRYVRWALPKDGRPLSIKYAFLSKAASFANARNCGRMLPARAALERSRIDMTAFRDEVRAAFDMWQAAIKIEFHETASIDEAGILIGAEAEPKGQAFTNVAPAGSAGSGVDGIAQSLICLNPEMRWKIGFDGNLDVYDLRYTLAHEIGHAIGLDHPGAEGPLMSYRYLERSRELRPGDVAGAIALYGPRGATPHQSVGALSLPVRQTAKGAQAGPAASNRKSDFGLGEISAPAPLPK